MRGVPKTQNLPRLQAMLRKIYPALFTALALAWAPLSFAQTEDFLSGDFIYIALKGRAGQVIRGTTRSQTSHCGVISLGPEGDVRVIHSLGRVKEEPLAKFLKWGTGAYAVNRLADLNQRGRQLVVEGARKFLGWPYDREYLVTNRSIYCSELLYRALSDGPGLVPVALSPMDFTVAGEEGWKFWEKFFQGKVPQGEPGIAPSDYLESERFQTIYDSFDSAPGEDDSEQDPLLEAMGTQRIP